MLLNLVELVLKSNILNAEVTFSPWQWLTVSCKGPELLLEPLPSLCHEWQLARVQLASPALCTSRLLLLPHPGCGKPAAASVTAAQAPPSAGPALALRSHPLKGQGPPGVQGPGGKGHSWMGRRLTVFQCLVGGS